MAKSVFSVEGASIFDPWPVDGWSKKYKLTHPDVIKAGFPVVLVKTNDEFDVHKQYDAGVLYRISDEVADEIILIGETGDTIHSRQYQRFRESRWVDLARSRELSIQVMQKKSRSKIERKEAESAFLRNFENQFGRIPRMNKRDQYPKKVRRKDWELGIRALARDIDKEGKFFGLRNVTRGKTDTPNQIWKDIYPLIKDVEKDRIKTSIQVLSVHKVGEIDVILAFSSEGIYHFTYCDNRGRFHDRIPYRSLFLTDARQLGFWDEGTQSVKIIPSKSGGGSFFDFLMERVTDIALRTDWR